MSFLHKSRSTWYSCTLIFVLIWGSGQLLPACPYQTCITNRCIFDVCLLTLPLVQKCANVWGGACVCDCVYVPVSVCSQGLRLQARQKDCECMPWHTSREGELALWLWQDKQSMQQYVATHDAKLLLLLQLNVSVLFPSAFCSPAVFIPQRFLFPTITARIICT